MKPSQQSWYFKIWTVIPLSLKKSKNVCTLLRNGLDTVENLLAGARQRPQGVQKILEKYFQYCSQDQKQGYSVSCINLVKVFLVLYSDAGRGKTLGVPVVIGGDNLSSPVGIGLTDLPNNRGVTGPPGPPSSGTIQKCWESTLKISY